MKVKKLIKNSQYLSSLIKYCNTGIPRINKNIISKKSFGSSLSFDHLASKSCLVNVQNKNFSILKSNEFLFELHQGPKDRLLENIRKINDQEKSLYLLKKHFEENKSDYLNINSSKKLKTFSCPYKCITINPLFSTRFDKSKNTVDFFITESRNELKRKLKSMIKKSKIEGEQMQIQICGSVGTGKTFGLAEFVVLERMLNLQSNDKFIIYYNFNETGNSRSLNYIRDEIFCAIYPLIKDELEKILNSDLEITPIILQKNSLMHIVLRLFKKTIFKKEENLSYFKQILNIVSKTHPNSQILIILDQINEVGKGNKTCPSIALFEFFKEYIQNNLLTIFCASNTNEFNRNNLLYDENIKILNYDLNLNDEEAVSIIEDKGITDEEYIRGVLKITNKVPLFMNYLSNEKGNDMKRIEYLKKKIFEYLYSRAENFFNNHYKEFDEDLKKEKSLFKEIIYCLNSDVEFKLYKIKEIMDYQLFDFEFLSSSSSDWESKKAIARKKEFIPKENQVLIDFYDYLENNCENENENRISQISELKISRVDFDIKVRVKTKYPMILKIYEEIFKKNNENLICPDNLTSAIRHYLNNYYKIENNLTDFDAEIRNRSKWGFFFEDIINIYISQNKDKRIIPYPQELSFFEKWDRQKYYDAITPKKKIFRKEDYDIVGTRDYSMLYSQYPPRGYDLFPDLLIGLYFTNLTSNHKTIDGGFAYLTGERDEKTVYNLSVLNLITYDVTIADKAKFMDVDKIKEIKKNLKRIYPNIQSLEKIAPIHEERFIKHYFIILENDIVYDINDKIDQPSFTKSDKLWRKLKENAKEDLDMFGIINARFVKCVHEEQNVLTIQLIPLDPAKVSDK